MDNNAYNNKYYTALETFGRTRRGEPLSRARRRGGRRRGIDWVEVGLTEVKQ